MSKVTLSDIAITDHEMIIGITSSAAISGKTFEGTWFSADDFKLYFSADGENSEFDYNTKVESVIKPENLTISIVDKRIVANEGQSCEVYTTTGQRLNANTPLETGVYIVRSGNQCIKVVIN